MGIAQGMNAGVGQCCDLLCQLKNPNTALWHSISRSYVIAHQKIIMDEELTYKIVFRFRTH